jgi:hypothetical protein
VGRSRTLPNRSDLDFDPTLFPIYFDHLYALVNLLMTGFYDDLETRDPAARERVLFAVLPGQIEHARRNSTAFARTLADVDSAAFSTVKL